MTGKGKEDSSICEYCDLQFRDHTGVQRHLFDKKCAEMDAEEDDEIYLPIKKRISDPSSSPSSSSSAAADLEEDGIRFVKKRLNDENKDYLREKRRSYEDKNLSRDWIDENMSKIGWRIFKKAFTGFLLYFRYFKDGPKTVEIL
jgi:hypothetical protein